MSSIQSLLRDHPYKQFCLDERARSIDCWNKVKHCPDRDGVICRNVETGEVRFFSYDTKVLIVFVF